MNYQILIFITNTRFFFVIFCEKNIIQIKNWKLKEDLTENLVENMNLVLKKNKIFWSDINEIYSSLEPMRHTFSRVLGSFLRTIYVLNQEKIKIYLINSTRFLAGDKEVVVSIGVTKKSFDVYYWKKDKLIKKFNKMNEKEIEILSKEKFKNIKFIFESQNYDFDIFERFLFLKNKFKLTIFKELKPSIFKFGT